MTGEWELSCSGTFHEKGESLPAEKKLAHQRLSLLELTEMLGSVSEACRRTAMTFPEDADRAQRRSSIGTRCMSENS